jgi:hypothetical protein
METRLQDGWALTPPPDPKERALARLEGWPQRASWFETREAALLAMRKDYAARKN